MSKISTYEVVPVPKLADKLIGTSVGGEIEDVTYNFTLQELLDLYIPLMPANNLQGILDFGNTATQDINLFGTITTTYLNVTDTANLYITYLNEETHIVGSVFDSLDLVGTPGQVLTSTGEGVEWYTLPPIFTPNLQQVLTEGNTADIDIILDANLEALDVSANTASIADNIDILGTITDGNSEVGSAGQVLESIVTGVRWVNLPVYSATSPLLFNSATNTFSIQPANSTQGGYLTANDWITFNGKQDAGSYITALTGEATATGPGSVPITLNNASVIAKVLTGLNVTGGSISASDSILTAFGKVQSQINGLMGGVQYQGVWNANTNTPTLTSSVGTQGHYYIVNVAGSTDLNGITDWKVGDWAIFSGGTWQKVDNTESVTSVNGQTGAVSLTTDDIPEGSTNLYYLNSRARGALSFAAGSGAYNSLTGVITIPTDNNQILNGAGYITLASLSATAPLTYNNLTGAFGIPKATTLVDGYLSAIDWTTFNNKQNYLGGTGLVKSTAGTITYITDNSGNWNTAYDRSIVSAAVTGTTTKTLTLNEQDGNTITASWTDLDTGLTSVGVSMPSAFSVANSPLTANGTIAITGAGTTLEYIDGTGALRTFPSLTGYVPYTGATTNVDLGEYGISAGYFQADLTPSGALQVGRMQWNSVDGTMDLRLMGNNVTLQIGEENVTRVVNKSGVDLMEANYQVVRIRKVAEGGAQGQRLAVVLAQGNNENNSTEVLGLVTETILVNQEGFVTNFGEVKQINTTGSLQGETWVDGDVVYLSATIPGQLTNIRPIAPNHAVIVGYVTYAHANNGKIYVAVDTGYELGELHNVYAPSPVANASIWWNSSTLRYENNTIAGILGYTPANDALVVHLAGTETITGAKTFTTKVTVNTGGVDDQLQLVGAAPSVRLTNAVSGATINGFIAMAGAVNNYIQGAVAGDMTIGNQNNGRILFGFGAGTATQKMSLDASGNAIIAGSLTLGTTLSNGTYTYTLPGATGTLALTSDLTGYVTAVTASGPLASSGGTTPNITIQQASGSQDGYLSSTDWTTFNNKQAAGNYITSLTGEATASGPGAASVTLSNAAVTGKVLTGINITGGTVQATDSILTGFGKLQNQINGLIGSTIYQGTWNASTNTPTLTSGVGTRGHYYIVNVAGSTNLDGITDWNIGDWAIFDGTAWQQVDNTDAVTSVNGQTGAVSLTTDNISEGTTNLYYTNARARAALSFTAGSGDYNSTTGVITIPTNTSQLTNGANFITLASLSGTAPIVYSNTTGAISITQAGTASNGYLSSTDWNTFNNKQNALTNPVTGTGTNNYIAKFTTTGSTIGNSIIYDNGSVVAIGTNTTGFNSYGLPLVVGSGAGNQGITVYSGSAGVGSLHFAYGTSGDQSYRGGLEYSHSGNQLNLLAGAAVGLIVGVNQVIVTQSSAHSAGSENFYVEGNARINTTLSIGGQLTLGSTITNGTYTYTLPGATGTLALTSQIPSLAGYVTGSGTANYIPKFTTSSNIGNSIIQEGTGGIGIGIGNTTTFKLRVYGGIANYVTSGSGGVGTDRNTMFDTNGNQLDFVSYAAGSDAYSNSIGIFSPTVAGISKDLLLMAGSANIRFVTGGYTEIMRVTSDRLSIGSGLLNVGNGTTTANIYLNRSVTTSVENAIRWQTNGTNDWYMGSAASAANSDFEIYNYGISGVNFSLKRSSGAAAFSNGISATNITLGSGTIGSIPSWMKVITTDATQSGIGAIYNNKAIYLYNNGSAIKLDAYDYSTSTPLNVQIGNNGGQVLIGTATAISNETLLVYNPGNVARAIINNANSTGQRQSDIMFDFAGVNNFQIGAIINYSGFDDQLWVRGVANLPMTFRTNDIERLRITPAAEFWYVSEDNNVARAKIYYNYAANQYRVYGSNSSGATTGIKIAQFNGSAYENVVTEARTLSINGVTYDLSANRSWTVSASSVAWQNVTIGTRTNYDLGFRPADNTGSYAGFQFSSYGGTDGNAGYLLIRGGTDNDVYTNGGITMVADVGWLTLAQRTRSDKGVRIMTGSTSTERLQISSAGYSRFFVTAGGAGSSDRVSIVDSSNNLDLVSYVSGGAAYSGSMGMFVSGGKDMLLMAGSANIRFVTGGYTEQMRLNNNGNFSIGYVGDGGYKLYVSGTIYATGDVIAYSDARVKTNIRPIENVLQKINNSRGIIYDRIDNGDKDNIGFIAQELEQQFPELISVNSEGKKGVKYQNAVAVLFEAIKEQQKQIEQLKKQIA